MTFSLRGRRDEVANKVSNREFNNSTKSLPRIERNRPRSKVIAASSWRTSKYRLKFLWLDFAIKILHFAEAIHFTLHIKISNTYYLSAYNLLNWRACRVNALKINFVFDLMWKSFCMFEPRKARSFMDATATNRYLFWLHRSLLSDCFLIFLIISRDKLKY